MKTIFGGLGSLTRLCPSYLTALQVMKQMTLKSLTVLQVMKQMALKSVLGSANGLVSVYPLTLCISLRKHAHAVCVYFFS